MSFADYIGSIGGKPINIAGQHHWPDSGLDGTYPTYPRPTLSYGATNYTTNENNPSLGMHPAYVNSGGGFLGWGDSIDALKGVPQLATGYSDYVVGSGVIENQRLQNEQLRQQIANQNKLAQQQYANSLPSVANIPSLVSSTPPVTNMGGWGSQPTQQTGMLGGLHRGSHGGLGMLSGGLHRGGNQ